MQAPQPCAVAPGPAAAVHPAGHAPPGAGAKSAGRSPPGTDEAPRLAGTERFRGQGRDDSPDSAGHLAGAQPANEKRFATLAARLALAGWELTRTDAGDGPAIYHATRWGMATPELPDLAAVESFADRVGAPR